MSFTVEADTLAQQCFDLGSLQSKLERGRLCLTQPEAWILMFHEYLIISYISFADAMSQARAKGSDHEWLNVYIHGTNMKADMLTERFVLKSEKLLTRR